MSRKPFLPPFHSIVAGDVTADLASPVTNLALYDNVSLQYHWDGVKATGFVTVGAVVATETFTLNGSVFTASDADPSDATTFKTGTPAEMAANLAAAINTSVDELVAGLIVAYIDPANAAKVLLTAVAAGTTANAYSVAKSLDSHFTLSGGTLLGGGFPTGTVAIQGSIDYNEQLKTGTWTAIPGVTPSNPAGSKSAALFNLTNLAVPFIRVIYTKTSGVGTFDCWISAKGI